MLATIQKMSGMYRLVGLLAGTLVLAGCVAVCPDQRIQELVLLDERLWRSLDAIAKSGETESNGDKSQIAQRNLSALTETWGRYEEGFRRESEEFADEVGARVAFLHVAVGGNWVYLPRPGEEMRFPSGTMSEMELEEAFALVPADYWDHLRRVVERENPPPGEGSPSSDLLFRDFLYGYVAHGGGIPWWGRAQRITLEELKGILESRCQPAWASFF